MPAWASLVIIFTLILLPTSRPAIGETDFESWTREQQERIQGFQQQQDRAFLGFLEKEWERFEAFKGIVQDTTPKPTQIPVAPLESESPPCAETEPSRDASVRPVPDAAPYEPVQPSPDSDDIPDTAPAERAQPAPATSQIPDSAPAIPTQPSPLPTPTPEKPKRLSLSFYGAEVGVDCGEELQVELGSPLNEQTISRFWADLSKAKYVDCLEQAREHRTKLHLNDWGYLQLLNQISSRLHRNDPNAGVLLVWFMMGKSGYDARVGYSGDDVVLLAPALTTVYGTPYFTLDNTRYYCLLPADPSVAEGGLHTYGEQLPGASAKLDLSLSRPFALPAVSQERVLTFEFRTKSYEIPLELDRTTADYLERYPQTDFSVYFSATPSPVASHSLLASLQPLLVGLSKLEAVDLLLCAVQTGFSYQTDGEQFGREKPLLPDETLYYPSSDCEDRSILFSFLVRELLGLPVVGLDYPGHIATAVGFGDDVAGASVIYHNKRFVICDPTYINASAGMCMPQFSGVHPGIIAID